MELIHLVRKALYGKPDGSIDAAKVQPSRKRIKFVSGVINKWYCEGTVTLAARHTLMDVVYPKGAQKRENRKCGGNIVLGVNDSRDASYQTALDKINMFGDIVQGYHEQNHAVKALDAVTPAEMLQYEWELSTKAQERAEARAHSHKGEGVDRREQMEARGFAPQSKNIDNNFTLVRGNFQGTETKAVKVDSKQDKSTHAMSFKTGSKHAVVNMAMENADANVENAKFMNDVMKVERQVLKLKKKESDEQVDADNRLQNAMFKQKVTKLDKNSTATGDDRIIHKPSRKKYMFTKVEKNLPQPIA